MNIYVLDLVTFAALATTIYAVLFARGRLLSFVAIVYIIAALSATCPLFVATLVEIGGGRVDWLSSLPFSAMLTSLGFAAVLGAGVVWQSSRHRRPTGPTEQLPITLFVIGFAAFICLAACLIYRDLVIAVA